MLAVAVFPSGEDAPGGLIFAVVFNLLLCSTPEKKQTKKTTEYFHII